jgi:hypothetical protein
LCCGNVHKVHLGVLDSSNFYHVMMGLSCVLVLWYSQSLYIDIPLLALQCLLSMCSMAVSAYGRNP